MTSVLVVGASGILAPLALELAARGDEVVAVGREPSGLARLTSSAANGAVRAIAADTTSKDDIRRVIDAAPYDHAIMYAPAVPPTMRPRLLERVVGRAVLVLTSAAADPQEAPAWHDAVAAARPRPGDAVVLLGWAQDRGAARWHTPAEVSAAALRALDAGQDSILGEIRPWNERPGASTEGVPAWF